LTVPRGAGFTPSIQPMDTERTAGRLDCPSHRSRPDFLACPLDKQPVTRQGNYLVCQECQRHYPIRDGIPVMLIEEALTPEQAANAPV
jgi:uncharacterized protein